MPDHANAEAVDALFRNDAFVVDIRRQMLRFATLQLGNADLAEDAVQEALIGAMKNARSFARRAAFKTWVFAILKHKIADQLRARQRLVPVHRLLDDEQASDDEIMDSLFKRGGPWRREQRPQHWREPDEAMQDQHFWETFESCLEHLPGRQARAFMMREFVGLETAEICRELSITVTNLNVTLHRARLRLRECLENHWFAGDRRS
ncbi:RNA polymerase factor sigma-70 [Oleiagrimonas sp.]|jgi:RNA polymerase sigma-70 factor (TIGR02943 family)|uniref:RNA polymerase factor sigma-70 n=1 Tax=Oleiagrimonas sp. TaxID=2010330 RepID=UPI00261F302D|nr:RNA polymerase factor sigma-70 [Oleiagrimonas sp.]MDA3914066.1 RNA polymerase factor sigma-70 [Oleiagrimonas sp.]